MIFNMKTKSYFLTYIEAEKQHLKEAFKISVNEIKIPDPLLKEAAIPPENYSNQVYNTISSDGNKNSA